MDKLKSVGKWIGSWQEKFLERFVTKNMDWKNKGLILLNRHSQSNIYGGESYTNHIKKWAQNKVIKVFMEQIDQR